jgi:ferritin-like protein
MATSSSGFHESDDRLRPSTRDMHRALASLMEELEAVDWYQQRVDAAGDADLRGILAHNRDEEIEHAAMLLEWLRRQNPAFDAQLRRYLFSAGPIAAIEGEGKAAGMANGGAVATLGPLRRRS